MMHRVLAVSAVVAALLLLTAARTSLAADNPADNAAGKAADQPAAKDVYDYDGQKNAPAGTKRIVFIATHGTHGGIGSHEFLAGSLYLARRINAVYPNAWAVVYTEDKWPKDLSDADGIIVMLNHGGKAAEDPLIKAACAKGAGYMAVHFGVEVNKGQQGDNYLAWMGGYFETFWSVNPIWKPEIEVGKHPTANGVKPFSIVDEWYYHMRFVDGMTGVTPILSAVAPVNTVHFDGKASDRGGNADVLKAVENKEPQVLAWAYDAQGRRPRLRLHRLPRLQQPRQRQLPHHAAQRRRLDRPAWTSPKAASPPPRRRRKSWPNTFTKPTRRCRRSRRSDAGPPAAPRCSTKSCRVAAGRTCRRRRRIGGGNVDHSGRAAVH